MPNYQVLLRAGVPGMGDPADVPKALGVFADTVATVLDGHTGTVTSQLTAHTERMDQTVAKVDPDQLVLAASARSHVSAWLYMGG